MQDDGQDLEELRIEQDRPLEAEKFFEKYPHLRKVVAGEAFTGLAEGQLYGKWRFMGYRRWVTSSNSSSFYQGKLAVLFQDRSRTYYDQFGIRQWVTLDGVLGKIPQLIPFIKPELLDQPEKEERTMKELNAAALLREDTTTIEVSFDGGSAKTYTYVITKDMQVKVDDFVVVNSDSKLAVAKVVAVHDELQIEPQANRAYLWVVDVVRTERYRAENAKNKAIEDHLAKIYVDNARAAFRRSLGLESEQLRELLNGN